MKKRILTTAAALVCGAVLASCGASADYPFTAAAEEFRHNGRLYYANSDLILTYMTPEGEERPVCYDPLCTHVWGMQSECMAVLQYHRPDIMVVSDENGAPVIYYTDEIVHYDENMRRENVLYRIDSAKGTKTAVISGLTDRIGDFYLYGDSIWMTIQFAKYDEQGNETAYGSNIWRMDIDGGGLTQVTDFAEGSVNIAAMGEANGETVIYWVDYNNNQTLYRSPEDFSASEKIAEGVPLYGNFVEGGYLYYSVPGENTAPALSAPAHPADSKRDKNPDGTAILRKEKKLSAYYKLDMNAPEKGAEPVFDGVQSPNLVVKPFFIAGDYAYIIPWEPLYIETIAATASGLTGDKVTDSLGGTRVEVDYIVSDSGSKVTELNLVTGESRSVETPGFDPTKIIGVENGKLILEGYVVDGDRIRAVLEEEGVTSNSFTFPEIQLIPIG